jgi:hypothetical protein
VAGFPYRIDVLSGVDVGAGGARFVGVLWLLAGLGVITGGLALALAAAWWWAVVFGSGLLSLVLAALWWREAYAGLVIDIAALIGVATYVLAF